jgi:hypothetical protein
VTPDFRLSDRIIAGCRTAEKGEAARMRPDPVGECLRLRRLGMRAAHAPRAATNSWHAFSPRLTRYKEAARSQDARFIGWAKSYTKGKAAP